MDFNAAKAQRIKTKELGQMRNKLQQLSKLEPDQIAAHFDRRCSYCGGLIVPNIQEYSTPWRDNATSRVVVWPREHGCPQEAKALAQKAEEQARLAKVQRRKVWAQTLERAGLIGWLAEVTFESFVERGDWPEVICRKDRVMAYARALLDERLDKPWLILYGSYGTGKSHLAAALVRCVLVAGWRNCYFRVWTDYLRRFKAAWKRGYDDKGECEADIVAEMQEGRLVIIDDLDKRRPTDWTREELFSVLNYRYNANLPTVLTFNYGPGDKDPKAPGRLALEEYLGRATLDRLIGAAFDVVEFNGPSYRSGVSWAEQQPIAA